MEHTKTKTYHNRQYIGKKKKKQKRKPLKRQKKKNKQDKKKCNSYNLFFRQI